MVARFHISVTLGIMVSDDPKQSSAVQSHTTKMFSAKRSEIEMFADASVGGYRCRKPGSPTSVWPAGAVADTRPPTDIERGAGVGAVLA